MVALLALGLAVGNLASRDNSLVPLIWVQAIAPGIVCAWLLFGPQLRLLRWRHPPRRWPGDGRCVRR